VWFCCLAVYSSASNREIVSFFSLRMFSICRLYFCNSARRAPCERHSLSNYALLAYACRIYSLNSALAVRSVLIWSSRMCFSLAMVRAVSLYRSVAASASLCADNNCVLNWAQFAYNRSWL
jgi:hypothetical protein